LDHLKFYKLEIEPFQNDLESRFYYESDVQRQARLRIVRGIYQRKGLSTLIGDAGCGKTTLAYHLRESLAGEKWNMRMLVIPHAACGSGWFLRSIARAFGVAQPASDPIAALSQNSKVLVELASRGSHPVLFVDEAHLLSDKAVLEEFRALLNLLHKGRKLLSLVLFGLPALDEILRSEVSLAQRVEIRVEIGSMNLEETAAYLQHRLTCAGGNAGLFGHDAIDALYAYTNGVPRMINTLADNSLFEGFLKQSRRIDGSLVTAAAKQLGLAACEAAAPGAAERMPPLHVPSAKIPVQEEPDEVAGLPALRRPRSPAPGAAPSPGPGPSADREHGHEHLDPLVERSPKDRGAQVSLEKLIAEMDDADASESALPSAATTGAPADDADAPEFDLSSAARTDVPADDADPSEFDLSLAATSGAPADDADADDQDFEVWLANWQEGEEGEAALDLPVTDEAPASAQAEDAQAEEDESLPTFENLWSKLQAEGELDLLGALPPTREEGGAPSGGAPEPDEEATVVGITPSDELLSSSPRSAVKKSAEAGAEDIDALFDEIRIGD
jgi:type II secretory pathway predicted ATPase ExeA